jgi:CBS domain-containing protein
MQFGDAYFAEPVLRGSDDGGPAPQVDDAGMTTRHRDNSKALSFERATVADAMTARLISCSPDSSLRTVAALMAERRVHAVYVFDYGDEDDETTSLWGIVSDLDLVAAACADVDSMTAGDSAVTPLVTITRDDALEHAAQRMAETGVSHLAVIDPRTGRPVGVLSTLDIADFVAAGGGPRRSSSVWAAADAR